MIKNFSPLAVPMGTPDRAVQLLKAGWAALELNTLQEISQNELSLDLGVSAGTLINWTNRSTKLNQIEAVLRILERLPTPIRCGLIERFLRSCPTIEAPEFAHDPAAVSKLRLLLLKRSGLTWIQGGNDFARTFVLTALCHSFRQAARSGGSITGVDVHTTDWFVPIDGVSYLPSQGGKAKLREDISKAWPRPNHAAWLVLNGAWSLVPEKHQGILECTTSHHVVIAEGTKLSPAEMLKALGHAKQSVDILQLAESDTTRIHVEFHLL